MQLVVGFYITLVRQEIIMKKLLLILFILLSLNSYSQSAKETIDYINSIVQSYLLFSDFDVNFQDDDIRIVEAKEADKSRVMAASFLEYKKIKNVIYQKQLTTQKLYIIKISGGGKKIDLNEETKTTTVSTIFLNYNIPETKIKRLIIAIKHLAKLKGAKLINEDLF